MRPLASISAFIISSVLLASVSWADVAWFVAPYIRVTTGMRPVGSIVRACAIKDFQAQITADGGTWRAVEALGNLCIAKVRASAATIQAIAGQFTKIPAARLDTRISTLTPAQRNALRQLILNAGYSLEEVTTRFPNFADNTVGDALRFLASRRRKARYDQATDQIMLDGPLQPTDSLDDTDTVIQ